MGLYNLKGIDGDFLITTKGTENPTIDTLRKVAKLILSAVPDNYHRDMAISSLLNCAGQVKDAMK